MKKVGAILVLFIVIVVGIIQIKDYAERGKTDRAVLDYGMSKKFSKEEIREAMDCAMKEFKSFSGCELKFLGYSEKASNFEYGVSNVTGIVLSACYVDNEGNLVGNLPKSQESLEFEFLLVREDKKSPWKYYAHGYC